MSDRGSTATGNHAEREGVNELPATDSAAMTAAEVDTPRLEVHGVSKAFPGVQALSNVDITLKRGEVLAVVGENGAGKSTLMKILAGVESEDAGTIVLEGRQVEIGSVDKALQLGIVLVHQELNLCDNLSIADNVFLGRELALERFGVLDRIVRLVDRRSSSAETSELLSTVGLEFPPDTIVSELSVGSQQLVEIAKALSVNAGIVIFDEPTSSLSGPETERLFSVIRDLRNKGVSVIYISHRLGEVNDIADRVVVLRDGKVSGELNRDEISKEAMIRLMVGRDIEKFYDIEHTTGEQVRLEVRDLVIPGQPGKPINLSVRAGEILVLSGLVGAGRTELAEALYGVDPPWIGQVFLDGREVRINNPNDAISEGMLLIPEDRRLHGLVVQMDVANNIALPALRERLSKWGVIIERDKLESLAHRMVESLDVRLRGIEQIVETLSGGNQQKVVVAKWLAMEPRVLILDEPTRGIDVVAKEEVYRIMQRLANAGVAMLVISSEMQEVLSIADRILVMADGRITGELLPDEFSEENVMKLATKTERE